MDYLSFLKTDKFVPGYDYVLSTGTVIHTTADRLLYSTFYHNLSSLIIIKILFNIDWYVTRWHFHYPTVCIQVGTLQI